MSAAPDAVWRAWTAPEAMKRWFAPSEEFSVPIADAPAARPLILEADAGLTGCNFAIRESSHSNAFSVVRWPDDEARRFWYVGPLNVGLVMGAYASHPKERADAGLIAEKPSICRKEE